MNLAKNLLFTGIAVAGALLALACSGPTKPANEGAGQNAGQPAQDPKVQVIDLPPPVGAKPGQKIHVVVSPYPPGSQGAKDAAAEAIKNSKQPVQP